MHNPRQILKSGDIIFSEGETGDCAYIVDKGKTDLFIMVDHKSVRIGTVEEGQLFGEMALIDNQLRSSTAKASEATELIIIPRKFYIEKINEADEFIALLLKVTLERYRHMRTHLENVLDEVAIDHAKSLIELEQPSHVDSDARQTTQQLQQEQELLEAFEHKHLEMFYQPIIELENNHLAGCEALIRWRDPERGLIKPDDFIGLAEQTGLIIPIGLWVIEETCLALKRFNSTSLNGVDFMSINLSGRQFAQADLCTYIKSIFSKYNVDPRKIKFEITESILIANPMLAINFLNEIKNLGSKIVMDDFGTGYSSFSYLHRFPIDSIKIDQSFTFAMRTNPKSFEIVKSLCILANSLNMTVIAEGVESAWENNQLKILKANYAQGYFYAKPLPEDEFKDFMLNWN